MDLGNKIIMVVLLILMLFYLFCLSKYLEVFMLPNSRHLIVLLKFLCDFYK